MNINVCKKILNSVLFFIAFMIVAFVINTFLFKFRFSETAPSIYEAIPGAIGGTLATAFFVKKDIKKSDIYFLIIFIILVIVVYFFVLNWHLKLIMLY